ncbi:hypothetical protein MLD38_002425 [Melastoma candidum]|uniref:Uncharacterized protein n=1 Tax=Melastoma candidum TaxID=119954 RepID=A0ACB9RZW2_9MYRT|nr:hypothetical protein MLD38_002425 [Melastoma candidum]
MECHAHAQSRSRQQRLLSLTERSFGATFTAAVVDALEDLTDNFTVSDPGICGHPIVFASRGFLELSGYSKEEVIGRNGRVFQGPKTNRRSVMEIREAEREGKGVVVSLLNHWKDGSPFWMLFQMCPVFSAVDWRVTHFVAVQVPISGNRRRNSGWLDARLCEGSCRREVLGLEEWGPGCGSILDSDSRGLQAEEQCEASNHENRKAARAIHNIMSILTNYSQLANRLACGRRCCSDGLVLLGSSVVISLGRIKQSFVLSDVNLLDMPIVYASDAFLKLTGYNRNEVLGRNYRFLNGDETDSSTVLQIKECIHRNQPCTARILNYRKDGSSFWNVLHISPVRNASGKISHFVGIQIEEGCPTQKQDSLTPEMRQRGTVGAVRVALRTGVTFGFRPSCGYVYSKDNVPRILIP